MHWMVLQLLEEDSLLSKVEGPDAGPATTGILQGKCQELYESIISYSKDDDINKNEELIRKNR